MRRTALRLALGTALAASFASAVMAQDLPSQHGFNVIEPNARVIKVWDCEINRIAKGWAINGYDCRNNWHANNPRDVLDEYVRTVSDLKGYEVVGQSTYLVQRKGFWSTKIWRVYDFKLMPQQPK